MALARARDGMRWERAGDDGGEDGFCRCVQLDWSLEKWREGWKNGAERTKSEIFFPFFQMKKKNQLNTRRLRRTRMGGAKLEAGEESKKGIWMTAFRVD